MCYKKDMIEEIRKSVADDDIPAAMLEYVDAIALAFQEYFDSQLPIYIAQAQTQTVSVTKSQAYDDIFDKLYEILANIYSYGQKSQLDLDVIEVAASQYDYDNFAINDIDTQAYINSHTGELIKGIDETTQKQVQDIILNAVAKGDTLDTVAATINDKFTQYNEIRSYLIAKQDLRIALEEGRRAQFESDAAQAGVGGRKKSYSQGDDQVRDTHAIAEDAGRIPAADPFPGVDQMTAPYDFGCRCTNTYSLRHPDEITNFNP